MVVMLVIVVLRIYCVVARWGEKVQSAPLTTKCGIQMHIVAAGGAKVATFVTWEEDY